MSYRLGIDTGGTYTDAVLVDTDGGVVASQKSLTTAFDLSLGINAAIGGLPSDLLSEVELVALSTTLTTNSVVEDRGAPVAVLLPGYAEPQLQRSGLLKILERQRIALPTGGHDATGRELGALDLAAVEQFVEQCQNAVSAFAVSAMFGTRNAAHERECQALIGRLCGKPVVCGHELASSLGAPRRALTTALNARMIPFIDTLIGSVEEGLGTRGIRAPLMIVKGDGSLINVKTARRQPIATVLSGPAASVIGACHLSGRARALVVDMGGTTTDVAIVHDGVAERCDDGARIGDWQPMIEAIRVVSFGLGGDSELRFNGELFISGRRVVPMSLLMHQHPDLIARLRSQWQSFPNARQNRFALPLQHNEVLIRQLDSVDRQAWDALQRAPADIDALADADRERVKAIARLERLGLAIYSGFTPSDATHVLGLSDHWNTEAAELGARLWARQMRYLYGCGQWAAGDAVGPSEDAFALVSRTICLKLIEAGLSQHSILDDAKISQLTSLLAEVVLPTPRRQHRKVDDVTSGDSARPLFNVRFAEDYPIVAVGGPAGDYFPAVARELGMTLDIPPHASTANAIGAAVGSVVQSADITVTQPRSGTFHLFDHGHVTTFESLNQAMAQARERASSRARERAVQVSVPPVDLSATNEQERVVTITIRESTNHVKHDIDGELFVSATVTATATGSPLRTGPGSPVRQAEDPRRSPASPETAGYAPSGRAPRR